MEDILIYFRPPRRCWWFREEKLGPKKQYVSHCLTLPKTNIADERWWLGDNPFLLGLGLFPGAIFVSGRVVYDLPSLKLT